MISTAPSLMVEMSYGPDGLAPKNLSVGYANGAIGTSPLAAVGVLVLLVSVSLGGLIAIEDPLAGFLLIAGGALISVSLFRMAARRDQRTNRSPAYGSNFAPHGLLTNFILTLAGGLLFLLGLILRS